MDPLSLSLSLRRNKLALQYYIPNLFHALKTLPILHHGNKIQNLFQNKTNGFKPLNLRIPNHLNEIKINPKIIHDTILLKTNMDPTSTNSKTRTNQIIQDQNTPYHFPRKIPQHLK